MVFGLVRGIEGTVSIVLEMWDDLVRMEGSGSTG